MANIAKQIIGSFEDIGKDVVREAAQVPKDIAGKALESLSASSSQKKPVAKPQKPAAEQKIDKATARAALEQFANPQQKREPTVQERLEQEKRKKDEKDAKTVETARGLAPLPVVTTKAKRGNLYGIKQKASSEASKNVRQD